MAKNPKVKIDSKFFYTGLAGSTLGRSIGKNKTKKLSNCMEEQYKKKGKTDIKSIVGYLKKCRKQYNV